MTKHILTTYNISYTVLVLSSWDFYDWLAVIRVEITDNFLDPVITDINGRYLVIDGFGDPFCLLRFDDDIRVLLRPYDRSTLSRGSINNLKPISFDMSLVIQINLKDVSLVFKYKLLDMINICFQVLQELLVSLFDYVV